MIVVMNVTITGSRDGADWPPAGGTVEVSDAEARHLIGGGLARPLVEAATAPKVESASIDTKPARKVRGPASTVSKSGGQW